MGGWATYTSTGRPTRLWIKEIEATITRTGGVIPEFGLFNSDTAFHRWAYTTRLPVSNWLAIGRQLYGMSDFMAVRGIAKPHWTYNGQAVGYREWDGSPDPRRSGWDPPPADSGVDHDGLIAGTTPAEDAPPVRPGSDELKSASGWAVVAGLELERSRAGDPAR